MNKLCLGTAQFGMDYGISNKDGKTPLEETLKILNTAADQGVDLIDTARLYGESEAVIGKALSKMDRPKFKIITKTPIFEKPVIDKTDAEILRVAFEESLDKLRLSHVEALLIHNSNDLLAPGGEHLYETMQNLKESGKINKIGVSVYEPKQLEETLRNYPVDLAQLPMNILDQRFSKSGNLAELKKREVEVHARSPFLQGLLLMDQGEIPPHFSPIHSLLKNLRAFLKKAALSPAQGALGFLSHSPEVDAIVMGVNNNAQLLTNLADMAKVKSAKHDFSPFSCEDARMINPSLWSPA